MDAGSRSLPAHAVFALSPPKAESQSLLDQATNHNTASSQTRLRLHFRRCLYRGVYLPLTQSALGADAQRPLRSTTYTPPSPHTGIEMGPMTADGKDGDPMPSSRPRERVTQSEPDTKETSIPKTRHKEYSIPPLHELRRPSKEEAGEKESRCRYLDLPISAGLPGLGQSDAGKPSSRPAVSKPIYHAANPTPSKFISLLHTIRLFSFCNMSLPSTSHGRRSFDASSEEERA